MKYINLFVAIILITTISCSKSDLENTKTSNIDIFGTYSGTLTNEITHDVYSATLEATFVDSQTVQMHCYSDIMDTIFTMNMYTYDDSIMLCYTDSMFNMEYGHHMSGNHHMMGDGNMGDNGMIDWQHHMDEEHDSTDMHYGGFNMMNHSCNYTIIVHEGNNEIPERFEGLRQ